MAAILRPELLLFPSLLHLVAEGARPAIVRLPADDVAGDLVDDNSLPHLIQVDDVLVLAACREPPFAVHLVHVREQVLDSLSQSLVGRPGGELERLDQVGMHRLCRVWRQMREPVGGGQVVPRCGRVSVNCGQHIRSILAERGSGDGSISRATVARFGVAGLTGLVCVRRGIEDGSS